PDRGPGPDPDQDGLAVARRAGPRPPGPDDLVRSVLAGIRAAVDPPHAVDPAGRQLDGDVRPSDRGLTREPDELRVDGRGRTGVLPQRYLVEGEPEGLVVALWMCRVRGEPQEVAAAVARPDAQGLT